MASPKPEDLNWRIACSEAMVKLKKGDKNARLSEQTRLKFRDHQVSELNTLLQQGHKHQVLDILNSSKCKNLLQ